MLDNIKSLSGIVKAVRFFFVLEQYFWRLIVNWLSLNSRLTENAQTNIIT